MKGATKKKESGSANESNVVRSNSSGKQPTGAIERMVRSGKQSRDASEDDTYFLANTRGGLVAAGKESRGESEQSEYLFGDVSRGLSKQFSSNKDNFEAEDNSFGDNSEKPLVLQDKKRLAGVGGVSAGALLGTAFLVSSLQVFCTILLCVGNTALS